MFLGVTCTVAVWQDETLCSLGMVSRDRSFVLDLGRGVRRAAKDSLQAALKTMNQVPLHHLYIKNKIYIYIYFIFA
jgi:hypothetical protein